MPCNSDHLEPSLREVKLQETACRAREHPIELLPLGRPTRVGNFYHHEDVLPFLTEDGQLTQLVRDGRLLGEISTPKPVQGMSSEAYMHRVGTVETENVAVRITSVRYDAQRQALMGQVEAYGPYAPIVQQMVEDGTIVLAARLIIRQDEHRKIPVKFVAFDVTIEE